MIEVSHDVIRLRPCRDEPRRRMRHFASVRGHAARCSTSG
jgi:hypothetical protein